MSRDPTRDMLRAFELRLEHLSNAYRRAKGPRRRREIEGMILKTQKERDRFVDESARLDEMAKEHFAWVYAEFEEALAGSGYTHADVESMLKECDEQGSKKR